MLSGEKTVEYRLFDEKRQQLRVGDEIQFSPMTGDDEPFLTRVVDLKRYRSFADAARAQGEDPEKFSTGMRKHYTLDEERKYGVLAIHIRLKK